MLDTPPASPRLKLISLNIQGHKHMERIIPFFQKENPDVLCLQEVFEHDLPRLKEATGMQGIYAPLSFYPQDAAPQSWGIALLSKLPMSDMNERYYCGSRDTVPIQIENGPSRKNGAFVYGTVKAHQKAYTIGTLHFTWTPDGEADAAQRRDLEALFSILNTLPEVAFCGDLNAPRGREIFTRIADKYKDNIPPEYATSIDGTFHRAGPLPYMVDGLFTTPGYTAEGTKLVDGLSDHCGIVSYLS